MRYRQIIGVVALLMISFGAYSQKLIRGFVIDSASFAPLAYVNVRIKNTYQGTSTDTKGGFAISISNRDTLVFSLVGYNEEVFAAFELEETTIIRMGVQVKQLETVTIVGRKEKTVKATHIAPNARLPNYGPYGAGVNLAYFTKLEKEKRKLAKVKAEQERVKSYVAVVCSPEVKERICSEYSLNDDQYFDLLARFNIANQNVRYDLSSEEWITVLRNYYAANVFQK